MPLKKSGQVASVKRQRAQRSFDIVVGIPSLNEADSIGFVVEQVDAGLNKFFPHLKSLIVNVDNNSPDDTKKVFLRTKTKSAKKYISTPRGVIGKGNNFYNLFKEVEKNGAQAVLVVDADLKSINPEWVKIMLRPVFSGYDYILPLYSRNEYDGTITNLICFPVIYGLLGYNIRQPIAGDFAFSRRLNEYWLNQDWQATTRQFGIDIFMTLHAIFGGFKLGQVNLGSKIHKPSAPKLNIMFTEVVTTLFQTILEEKRLLLTSCRQTAIPILNKGVPLHPQGLPIDYKLIKRTALSYYKKNRLEIKSLLDKKMFSRVDLFVRRGKMAIDKRMWQKIVFDTIVGYYSSGFDKKVIDAFKALYFLRVASYIHYTLDLNYKQSEEAIRELARLFKKNRSKLLARLEKN